MGMGIRYKKKKFMVIISDWVGGFTVLDYNICRIKTKLEPNLFCVYQGWPH